MNDAVKPRSARDGPYCWQSKEAMRLLHGAFTETDNLPSAVSIYAALSLIASDEQSETFTVRKALIAFKAGVSIRTAGDVLKRLEAMNLIGIKRQSTTGNAPDGASTYTLLGASNCCTPVGNGCVPVGNQPERSLIADKVEESKKNLSEESIEESVSSPSAAVRKFSVAEIDSIYQAYPRKKAPAEAKKAIAKHLSILAKRGMPNPADWLLGQVKAFAKTRVGEDEQFTPYPATWINAGRYDEEVSAPLPGYNGANGKPKPIGSMSALIAAHQQSAH